MPEAYFGLVEVALFYAAALGFCAWQLVQLRRDTGHDKEKPGREERGPTPSRR